MRNVTCVGVVGDAGQPEVVPGSAILVSTAEFTRPPDVELTDVVDATAVLNVGEPTTAFAVVHVA